MFFNSDMYRSNPRTGAKRTVVRWETEILRLGIWSHVFSGRELTTSKKKNSHISLTRSSTRHSRTPAA